ncbi:MAG: hypothetical protein ACM3KD_00705 [Hyphomicrobiaceae bacterium]
MRIFIPLAAAALLAGCATPAERAAQMQREADQMVVIYGPACERLGYKRDTDPWRDCILRLNARDSYEHGYSTTNCFGNGGFLQCTTF